MSVLMVRTSSWESEQNNFVMLPLTQVWGSRKHHQIPSLSSFCCPIRKRINLCHLLAVKACIEERFFQHWRELWMLIYTQFLSGVQAKVTGAVIWLWFSLKYFDEAHLLGPIPQFHLCYLWRSSSHWPCLKEKIQEACFFPKATGFTHSVYLEFMTQARNILNI